MNTLIVLYDPLCGWCYGAGAALAALDEDALVERAVRDGEPIAGNALFDGSLVAQLNATRAA
jgi:protein-disulfide isomerase-like protein with CxxC motif